MYYFLIYFIYLEFIDYALAVVTWQKVKETIAHYYYYYKQAVERFSSKHTKFGAVVSHLKKITLKFLAPIFSSALYNIILDYFFNHPL